MDEKNGSVIGRIADLLGGVAGRVIVAALLILIAVELSRFCYSFGRSVFYQDPMETPPGTDVSVVFEEGQSIGEASEILSEAGLIRDPEAFSIQAALYEVNIYPGEYTLNTSMTTKEIIEEINISEDEYQARLAESEKAESETEEDVIGGGDEADILTPEERASLEAESAASEEAASDGASSEGTGSEEQ